MAKKHRLKINYDEITEENFSEVQRMREHKIDGQTCEYEEDASREEGREIWHFNGSAGAFEIKKSWLTEIKEPLSFEEWDQSKYGKISEHSEMLVTTKYINEQQRMHREKGWNASRENDKIGVVVDEEKDEEAFYNFCATFRSNPNDPFVFWTAALKFARGQND